jgi:lipopolysaccharide export system permease protein
MKTLQRYIGRDVLFATLLIFGALLALFAFFDLIHELGDVGRGDYTISRALLFVTLHLPSRLYELFPVAALIGTLFALAQLVANSEYTVMRTSGMSLARVAWSVLRVGIPLAAATFLAGEYVAPPAERIAQTVRTSADSSRVVAQQFESGFWFKQDLTFVNIRTVLADMTLSGIRMYEFGDDLRLKVVRVAQSGTFAGNGQWKLENVKSTEIGTQATRVTAAPVFMWSTVLRPSILNVYQVAPERLELGTLYDNIRARQQCAEDVPVRDRILEQGVLSARRARDDDARAAVRTFPTTPGRRRIPHLRRDDDRAVLLSAGTPVLESRRAERLAAPVLRRLSAGVLHGDRHGDARLDRAALVRFHITQPGDCRPFREEGR